MSDIKTALKQACDDLKNMSKEEFLAAIDEVVKEQFPLKANDGDLLFDKPGAYSGHGQVTIDFDCTCNRCGAEGKTLCFCTCDGEYCSIDLCAKCLHEFTDLLK